MITRKDVPDPELDSSENLKECTEESPLNRQYGGGEQNTFDAVNVVNLSLSSFFYCYVTIGDIFKVFSSKKFCDNIILSHAQFFTLRFYCKHVSMFLKINTVSYGSNR